MANEAVKITLLGNRGDPIEYTIASGAVIPKGSIMKLTNPQTAAIATADGDYIIGIASVESTADSTDTTMALWTHGVFDMYSTTGMTLGKYQKIEGTNAITDADDNTVEGLSEVVGLSLETVGATSRGAILVNL